MTAWQTPCLDERQTAHLGVRVDPWNLDECTECEMCDGCAVHMCQRDDASILRHADWFRDFASPGETECGHVGGPAYLLAAGDDPTPCQLPAGHDGKHRARMGWSWPAVHQASS